MDNFRRLFFAVFNSLSEIANRVSLEGKNSSLSSGIIEGVVNTSLLQSITEGSTIESSSLSSNLAQAYRLKYYQHL